VTIGILNTGESDNRISVGNWIRQRPSTLMSSTYVGEIELNYRVELQSHDSPGTPSPLETAVVVDDCRYSYLEISAISNELLSKFQSYPHSHKLVDQILGRTASK
jgi:hypothetical protein